MKRAIAVLMIACVAAFLAPVEPAAARSRSEIRRHLSHRAKSQLGTDYRYGGESPRRGFDCSGFTRWTFKKVISLPHSSIRQYRRGGRDGYKRIHKRRRLKRGDLVFFKTTSAKVGHVGVYLSRGRFVHASSSADKVTISSVFDRYYYGPRFRGGVRIPQLVKG
ncbi:MAG: C40 family peptidase [Actinomycetota bacterium]|nr:C40 family peptidase [Actinomycetota bacterium]